MTEADLRAVEAALKSNPRGIAKAEVHLKKGVLILTEEIGLPATRALLGALLAHLESKLPSIRLH